jgi:hypothetical protein
VDVNPVYDANRIILHITINVNHLKDMVNRTHHFYSIEYQGKTYGDENKFYVASHALGLYCFNQLKFTVPVSASLQQGTQIYFSLFDKKFSLNYNLLAFISVPKQDKDPLAVCGYVSNYNSIAEIRAWLAFQKLQGVSKVILYVATEFEALYTSFAQTIQSGFLQLVDFTWYRSDLHGTFLQRNNQQAQMNSCINRFKYQFKAIINVDVDEFVFSKKYPFSLPSAVEAFHFRYPEATVAYVSTRRK